MAPLTTTTTSTLGTVLAVWAHPDDESFVAGGLLAAASDAGSMIVCVTATRGEQGTTDPDRWDRARLARTRTLELAAARAVLGIDEQIWLPFPDGGCDAVAPGRGTAAVARIIDEVQPDTIVTFGPDGVTGHDDHRAVSRWTSNAWAATGSRARLLWAAVTPETAGQMAAAEPVAGAFYPGFPHVVDRDDVALHLELRGELLDRKFAAMRAHATQSTAVGHRLGEEAFRRWWATESFVEVSPARPSSGPRHGARPNLASSRHHLVPGRRRPGAPTLRR